MVDLEYFVKELRDEEYEVVIFMDANQNESRCYRLQTHNLKFKSDNGFNIDGTIDGSLKGLLEDIVGIGMLNFDVVFDSDHRVVIKESEL
jgi:hypothetical protein